LCQLARPSPRIATVLHASLSTMRHLWILFLPLAVSKPFETRSISSRGGAWRLRKSPPPPPDVPLQLMPHNYSTSSSTPQLVYNLQTDPLTGLSGDQIKARLVHFGYNRLPVVSSTTSLFSRFVAQFRDTLVQILLGVAFVSSVLATWEGEVSAFLEPVVLLTILLLNAVVNLVQEQQADNALTALADLQALQATVVRNGQTQVVDAKQLVPGDVVQIATGDALAADGRLLQMQSSILTTDEASLTGESAGVQKQIVESVESDLLAAQIHAVYSGTTVTRGRATMVVTQTGIATQLGKISDGLSQANDDDEEQLTPLQRQLDDFGRDLGRLIGGICLVLWCASIPHFTATTGPLYYAKVSMALGVAAIPEGLPAVITLALSLGTRAMARQNVVVKRLPAVETLGCTTVICTDKTGTLTTNAMSVTSVVIVDETGPQEHGVTGVSYAAEGRVQGLDSDSPTCRAMLHICALCNDAQIVDNQAVGEPTEAALCTLVEKWHETNHTQVAAYRTDNPRLATLDFDRQRKSMSVLCRMQNGNRRLLVKGAPNLLLQRCTKLQLQNGKVVPLTSTRRRQIEAKLSEMAARPLRCLALAYKDDLPRALQRYIPGQPSALLQRPDQYTQIESGLTLVGWVGIQDPARPEVAPAIDACRQAGIRIIMITGDAKDTAVAIARDVGILQTNDRTKAYEGREFWNLTPPEQWNLLQQGNLVFCRAEPADKQRLIQMLQHDLGEVTAMTGDGVNDAPALKQASIGLAMGITGTEYVKC